MDDSEKSKQLAEVAFASAFKSKAAPEPPKLGSPDGSIDDLINRFEDLGGTMPESLPVAENIEKVAKRLKKAAMAELSSGNTDPDE